MDTNALPLDSDAAQRLKGLIGKSAIAVLECCDEIRRIDDLHTNANGQRSSKLIHFLQSTLKWSMSKFSNLATIARDSRIQNLRATSPEVLPTTWGALYQMTQFDDDMFKYGASGTHQYDHDTSAWVEKKTKPVIHQDATVSLLKTYRRKRNHAPEPKSEETRTLKLAEFYIDSSVLDFNKLGKQQSKMSLDEVEELIINLFTFGNETVRVMSFADAITAKIEKKKQRFAKSTQAKVLAMVARKKAQYTSHHHIAKAGILIDAESTEA